MRLKLPLFIAKPLKSILLRVVGIKPVYKTIRYMWVGWDLVTYSE